MTFYMMDKQECQVVFLPSQCSYFMSREFPVGENAQIFNTGNMYLVNSVE